MQTLVPEPISGGNGVAFDPVSYKGEFKWTNLPDVSLNPDGTIGFFRGIMASASKPIKTTSVTLLSLSVLQAHLLNNLRRGSRKKEPRIILILTIKNYANFR